MDYKVLNAVKVAHDLISGVYRKSNPTDSDIENECGKENDNEHLSKIIGSWRTLYGFDRSQKLYDKNGISVSDIENEDEMDLVVTLV